MFKCNQYDVCCISTIIRHRVLYIQVRIHGGTWTVCHVSTHIEYLSDRVGRFAMITTTSRCIAGTNVHSTVLLLWVPLRCNFGVIVLSHSTCFEKLTRLWICNFPVLGKSVNRIFCISSNWTIYISCTGQTKISFPFTQSRTVIRPLTILATFTHGVVYVVYVVYVGRVSHVSACWTICTPSLRGDWIWSFFACKTIILF